MSNFLDQLNPAQLEAVQHQDGPALILAGAGSGKTRVLTSRVAWLIMNNFAQPEEILLVTFTNKAAGEMVERVGNLTNLQLPFAGTFHRICARILRRDGHAIGLPASFVIFDSEDQLQLIKSVMKKLLLDPKEFKPSAIAGMISEAKNNSLSPTTYSEIAEGKYQSAAAKVYKNYQRELEENHAVDFDDLLLKTVDLFIQQPHILHRYQQQFTHVLVDEYQDTNAIQYQLTKLLAAPQNNLFVVGDAAQAIYSWRGADYRNMMQLKKDFPDIKEYRLEQNYRSTQTILDAASYVIQNNTSHPVLSLWTQNTDHQHPIELFVAQDNLDETRYIAETIIKNYRSNEFEQIAVLYRTNAQSRAFEEAFLKQSISYRIVGGVRFYARKEVKDLLCYLRLVLNPNETVSLERALKIGKRRYQQFDTWRTRLKDLAIELSPLEMLDQIIAATQYKNLFDNRDEEDLSRLENIEELRAVAHEFESLEDFLENVSLVDSSASSVKDLADLHNNAQPAAVTLMSIHSAKGLEYETVFLVGLEEGLFPHSRSLMDKNQLEEERRLCYVGITRAKNRLFLSYAQQRFFYGTFSSSTPSRFLREIPEELVLSTQSSSHHHSYNSRSNFQNVRFSPYASKKSAPPKPKRQIVVDDSELDDILSGEIDIENWLNS